MLHWPPHFTHFFTVLLPLPGLAAFSYMPTTKRIGVIVLTLQITPINVDFGEH